ncbi:MAG: hypothetical protein HRT90_11210 [Candidatus Margulisbacteria bacterium]|nr:hypothetical protein [Candidatus Margulisiibacteriota bacterium]
MNQINNTLLELKKTERDLVQLLKVSREAIKTYSQSGMLVSSENISNVKNDFSFHVLEKPRPKYMIVVETIRKLNNHAFPHKIVKTYPYDQKTDLKKQKQSVRAAITYLNKIKIFRKNPDGSYILDESKID